MAKARVTVDCPTTGLRLLDRGRVADGWWSRLRGLIGTRHLSVGQGMLIYPCASIHTWFMSMPIDVVYIAKDNRVLGIDRAIRPWRIGTMHRGVRYVIEVGADAAQGIQPGDELVLDGWQPVGLFGKIARALGS